MLLHIVVNLAQYRGGSGRIQPNPVNIPNCFLHVSYLNRITPLNGLKILQFSTNPAVHNIYRFLVIRGIRGLCEIGAKDNKTKQPAISLLLVNNLTVLSSDDILVQTFKAPIKRKLV